MTLKLVTSWFGLSVRAEGASDDTIVGGLEFVLFTSGSKTLVVAIGRAGQAYQYPAPVLRFGQTCALANARSVEWVQTALDMPGKPGETKLDRRPGWRPCSLTFDSNRFFNRRLVRMLCYAASSTTARLFCHYVFSCTSLLVTFHCRVIATC